MKLSARWLDELVGLDGRSAEDLAELLTFHTAAVEGVEVRGAGLEGVRTARVTAVRPHPDADRLRLCTVDLGEGDGPTVVCGAPNVAEGQIVCYAAEGLTLPNGMTLTRRKIRGVESAGMICAQDELGLGEDHAGIIVLPEDTALGLPVADVLGARDEILDIENTDITHRPDLWGHVGFAREVGVLLRRPFEAPATPTADLALEAADGEPFPIEIEDPDGCRRYVGIVIEGVTNGASPETLKNRLEALGMRSIDLVVDLTNLVMLEQGQPLHAFDLRDLTGGRIVVRRARPGETMTTLDGEKRILDPEDLLIADAERPVAIAGVMGGENSEVRADTTAILLESANFDPSRVRRTAARLGLRTEASSRFEKALDPVLAEQAARRFTELLLAHCPEASVKTRIGDAYPRPPEPRQIEVPYDLFRRRLGLKLSDGEIRGHLTGLGFGVREVHDHLIVDVPSWRATKDVECAADLVEEVGRTHGYHDIEHVPPVGALTPTRPSPLRRLERRLAATLSLDLGYAEAMAYSFYGPRDAAALGIGDVPHLRVTHPISEELDRMAQAAAPGLLRVASRNIAREARGRMWLATRLILPREAAEGLPEEIRVLGAVSWDREAADDPGGRVFLDLVEDVRVLLEAAAVGRVVVRDGADERLADRLPAPVWLHPGRRAVFLRGESVLAVVGEVAPKTARAYELEGRAAVAEIGLEAVLAATGSEGGLPYQAVHRFPVAPFDVAVIVPRRTPAGEVAESIARVDRKAVRHVRLFDVYEGEGIPEGHRSLAFTCELLDPRGTLDAKKADKLRSRIRRSLEAQGWTVRAGD